MEFFPTKDENKINESSKHRKEMKKNILKATLVAAFGLIAGFNVYNSQKSDVMSELALANVEALADDAESGEDFTNGTDCVAVWENYTCRGKDGDLCGESFLMRERQRIYRKRNGNMSFCGSGFFIRFRSKRGRIPNVSRRTFLFDIEGK